MERTTIRRSLWGAPYLEADEVVRACQARESKGEADRHEGPRHIGHSR